MREVFQVSPFPLPDAEVLLQSEKAKSMKADSVLPGTSDVGAFTSPDQEGKRFL